MFHRLIALAALTALPALADPVPGRLVGRVFERGSVSPIAGATLSSTGSEVAITDDNGHFELSLSPGPHEILIADERHEPMRATEQIRSGEGITVEYRLVPLPAYRRRYQTIVHGESRHEGARFSLRNEELHQTPGTLGDPFRAVALLPGVTQPMPLLPLYVVRGASPGMSGFFLDGMRIPALFHFLIGGGVIHPRLIDRLDFYPGSYDASFGHFAGGIIDAATRPARSDAPLHGEAQLSLYDLSALAEVRLPGNVRIAASGHYGYPGPLIHLIDPSVDINYWDYQLRMDWRSLTLEALGSFDSTVADLSNYQSLGRSGNVAGEYRVAFHRLQLRHRPHWRHVDLDTALVGGVDEMAVLGGFGVRKLALSARAHARFHLGGWQALRLDDLTLSAGIDAELSRFRGSNFPLPDVIGEAPDQLGELSGDRDGLSGGLYLQATGEFFHRRLTTTLGVRADVYHVGQVTLLGIDPRTTLRIKLMKGLALTGGFGLYQQPPSFPVALPGIDTYALQLGLQRAWQGASGVEAALPADLTLAATGFFARFANINDAVIDFTPTVCTSPPPESLSGLPAIVTRQVAGDSFGMELLLRRHTGRLTGWIAYTLSRSERVFSCGLRPADFDQTHVLNIVAQVRLPWNLMAGARLLVQTGRPYTQVSLDELPDNTPLRNNQRLPTYVQLDLRLDREWVFKAWAIAAFIEVLNTTYSRSILAVTYPTTMIDTANITRYDLPVPVGPQWILPALGIRGRF